MSFFKDMSLERAFILLSLLGSLALVFIGMGARAELKELETALETSVPKVANDLQRLSREHSRLTRAKDGDEFLRQDNADSYIVRCANQRGAEIGQVTIAPTRDVLRNGLVDMKYQVRPKPSDRSFPRENLAMFLYELEKGSEQIRVTDVDIKTTNRPRKVEDDQIPPNAWTFSVTCTSRQKE